MEQYKLLYGKDRRYGLFIHWGLYSIHRFHEQELMRSDISREEYEALISQFNPVNFSADEWVRFARDCGMSYICITTKHHDGFCLWNTAETGYNVMNTPFGRDIILEFSQACKKYNVGLALYYSIPDWHHPNAYNPGSTHQIPPRDTDNPDMVTYIGYVKRQITELLSNYGEICALFWDIPPHIDDPSVNELVRKLQPNIKINDRGFSDGDFSTPERGVPSGAFTGYTEACQSIGSRAWGCRDDEDYYTVRFLEASFDAVLSKGGNYLLGTGPQADGSISPEAVKIFGAIGRWYDKVGESYSGDAPTQILSDRRDFFVTLNGNNLYLHFTTFPETSGLCLYPLNILPESVTLLNTGAELKSRLDVFPTLYKMPRGKEGVLHVYDIPFEEVSNEVPVIRLSFNDISTLVENFYPDAMDESIY